MGNGSSTKHKGGIMLSAVFLVFIFSVLLLTALENHRLATTFAIRTQKLYVAKTMKEMFWYEYLRQKDPQSSGSVAFNQGLLRYQSQSELLRIWVDHGGGTFYFEEVLKKDKDKTVLKEN
ncbi:competence type IV pilus minor pilin ComGG [Enterococcus mediterraneensis]|uniref:competence type IV pilus minor pilin ComGG n=1 Tax=Enterococcus mediterraneensis TaxID=2364791 RepID=UPI000F05C5EE|nr:competence type IV pilus minor pilin ComGG [Enterococcus mediterraneensis]